MTTTTRTRVKRAVVAIGIGCLGACAGGQAAAPRSATAGSGRAAQADRAPATSTEIDRQPVSGSVPLADTPIRDDAGSKMAPSKLPGVDRIETRPPGREPSDLTPDGTLAPTQTSSDVGEPGQLPE